MEAAKIILIALFYAKILYDICMNIYLHGKATKVFNNIGYGDENTKKLDKAFVKRTCKTLIEGVIASVLFYYAGIFEL